MRKKVRFFALLLTPLLLIALVLAYLSSWRVQVIKTSGAAPFQVAFSPDGKYVAVAAHGPGATRERGSLDIWRVTAPGFLRPAKLSQHRRVPVLCPASLCFSGDSTRLVCTAYNKNRMTSWNPATGQHVSASESEGWRGSFVQPWPNKNTITYWTGNEIEQRDVSRNQISKPSEPFASLRSQDDAGFDKLVALAPNGKLIASTLSSYIINVKNGVQIRSVGTQQVQLLPFDGCAGSNPSCDPTALAFSPNSQAAIVSYMRTSYRGNTIANITYLTLLWDMTTRRKVTQWAEKSEVTAFAFSPDGTTIAEAHKNGSLHLREAISGKLIRASQAHRLNAFHNDMSVAFSPDGTLLASCGSDGTLRLTRVH